MSSSHTPRQEFPEETFRAFGLHKPSLLLDSLCAPTHRLATADGSPAPASARRTSGDQRSTVSAALESRNIDSTRAQRREPSRPRPPFFRHPGRSYLANRRGCRTGVAPSSRSGRDVAPHYAPSGVGRRSGRHARRRAGRRDGTSGPPSGLTTRPPAIAARRQRADAFHAAATV